MTISVARPLTRKGAEPRKPTRLTRYWKAPQLPVNGLAQHRFFNREECGTGDLQLDVTKIRKRETPFLALHFYPFQSMRYLGVTNA